MRKGNGKTNVNKLDLEHELPPAEAGDNLTPTPEQDAAGQAVRCLEVEKLKAERDALARPSGAPAGGISTMPANARPASSRNSANLRRRDILRNILPILDSFRTGAEGGRGRVRRISAAEWNSSTASSRTRCRKMGVQPSRGRAVVRSPGPRSDRNGGHDRGQGPSRVG